MREINDAGLKIVKNSEGCRLTTYFDIAGVPTIGWGHVPGIPGVTITQADADRLLLADISHAADTVDARTGDVAASDNQFAAMVSLAFNIGVAAFAGGGGRAPSSVLSFHRAGKFTLAANAFLLWDRAHVDGALQMSAGLLRRRQQERALYLSGAASAVTGPSIPPNVTIASTAHPVATAHETGQEIADDLNRAEAGCHRT